MMTYLDCWISVSTALFSQALAGEPELTESLPKPLAPGSFGFAATLAGEDEGRFSVILDGTVLDAPLMGDGRTRRPDGTSCCARWPTPPPESCWPRPAKMPGESFEAITGESKVSRAFQLKAGDRSWTILVRDDIRAPKPAAQPDAAVAAPPVAAPAPSPAPASASTHTPSPEPSAAHALSPGIELLLGRRTGGHPALWLPGNAVGRDPSTSGPEMSCSWTVM